MGKFAHAQHAVLQANYANSAALAATDATLATVATSATQAIEASEANEASLAEVSAALSANEASLAEVSAALSANEAALSANEAALSANEAALALVEVELPRLTPIGAIHHFYRASAPDGWLECTGQAVSRTTYADLFAVIGITAGAGDGVTTFNVPDLRDQFLRAWDRAGTRTLGDEQADALKAHTHDMDEINSTAEVAGYGLTISAGFKDRVRVQHSIAGTSLTTASTGDTETRPKNVALLCCIKY
jgi:microcystin-dependent protein